MLRQLPDGTEPPIVTKQDNDSTPVLTVALSADRSVRELTELADKIVRVQLERAAGVGEVRLVGGQERAIKIWVDADRLAAYGLPITAVRDAIAAQNANIPAGNVTRGQEERTLRTMGRFESAEALRDRSWSRTSRAARSASATSATPRTAPTSSARWRGSNGMPTVVLEVRAPVGRQHRRGDRGGQGEPRASVARRAAAAT